MVAKLTLLVDEWTRQPVGMPSPAKEDNAAIVSLWAGKAFDLKKGCANPNTATLGTATTADGLAVDFTSSSTYSSLRTAAFPATQAFTLVFIGRQRYWGNTRILYASNYEILPLLSEQIDIYIEGALRFTVQSPGLFEKSFVYSHDMRNTSNDPIAFVDGLPATVVRHSTPTSPTLSGQIDIGNHGSLDRPFDALCVGAALYSAAKDRVWCARVARNPWQIFEPEEIPLFKPVVAAQFLRPISDIGSSGWTPSSGSDLFPMINEAVRNDANYISANTVGAWFEVLLGTSDGDPQSSINHLPRFAASATGGGLTLQLKQGTTVIKEWVYASLASSPTLYEPTLTSGEIDSITDYTNLRLYGITTA